jgi:hypothetical protein
MIAKSNMLIQIDETIMFQRLALCLCDILFPPQEKMYIKKCYQI